MTRARSVRWQLVVTTPQPARAARFWQQALGYAPQPPPIGFPTWDHYAAANGIDLAHGADIDAAIDPSGAGPRLLFVRDDPAERGRLSIEILTGNSSPGVAAVRGRVVELVDAGARHLHTVDDDDHPWAQLLEPDRNPFRLI